MPQTSGNPAEELDSLTIFLHFGLMVFGVLTWISSFWAGDYKSPHHWGFTVHKMLGLGTTLFLAGRLFHGFFGPQAARFKNWVPCRSDQLKAVFEDLRGLLTLKLPDRPPHQGLAGLWEAFGLLLFTWMSATGFFMYVFLTPGSRARGVLHLVKELHELGEFLIPLFLGVHLGAVLLHALAGDHRWRKMFFLKNPSN
jgi:cytochrome b|uniref:Cytochrome b/b6 domain-containing protein n=1 Tax=Desulfobacca acetoxidans TaxID=60893 RepID=A0A7C5ENA8_9BACT